MSFPPSTPGSPAEEDHVRHIQAQSPLHKLPSEVRLLIYSYLLPQNKDISFHPITRKSNKGAPVPGYFWEPGVRGVGGLWLSVLLVCRLTYGEAADILYGSNRYHFVMTSRERMWHSSNPQSLNKPYARGLPINTLRAFPSSALRRMRSVSIRVEEDVSRPDPYRRVQTWLADAVSRFGGAEGGAAPHQQQHNGLQDLMVTLVCGEFAYRSFPSLYTSDLYWEFRPAASGPASATACSYQFVLEPLAQLRGVKRVEIRGHVMPGFAQRLANTMTMAATSSPELTTYNDEKLDDSHPVGDSGPNALSYDVQRLKKRRRGPGEMQPVMRTTRRFYEPVLDWGLNIVYDADAMDVDENEEEKPKEDPGDKQTEISQPLMAAPRKDSTLA